MKKLFSRMLLLAILSVVFFSCSKDKGIVGTWERVDRPELIIIINEDHSMICGMYDKENKEWIHKEFYTYKYQDNIMTVTYKGNRTDKSHISIDGKTMTVTPISEDDETRTFTYKRRKPIKM